MRQTALAAQEVTNRPEVLADLVSSAELIFSKQYPKRKYPGMDFHADRWDFTIRHLFVANRRKTVTFFRGNLQLTGNAVQTADPLPAYFAYAFKAWLVHANLGPAQATLTMQAARHFWHVLQKAGKDKATCWDELRNNDLRSTELFIKGRVGASSAVTYCRRLRDFIEWAVDERLIRQAVTWKPVCGAPLTDQKSDKTSDARRDRLPHRRLLEALGQIYLKLATEPRDRLIICAIGLLLVAGFRLGELLSLPYDCLGKKRTRRGEERWFITYWREKARGGRPQRSVRYLSPLGAELARACVREIRDLSKAARRQVRQIEKDTSRVKIPWGGKRWLSHADVARAFNISYNSLSRMKCESINVVGIENEAKPGHPMSYPRVEVEKELAKRVKGHFSLVADATQSQALSNTLLIEFALSGNGSSVSELLVEQLRGWAITSFLGGARHRQPSAFERFGFDQGELLESALGLVEYKIRSHAFRHWLNTVANKAGMTAFQITLWMQRSSVSETLKYLHRSSDIAELGRDLIAEGRVHGPVVELYNGLSPDEKPALLNTIREGHQTSNGNCLKALLLINCEIAKSCETNCFYYMWSDEMDQAALDRLRNRLITVRNARQSLREQVDAGERIQSRQLELLDAQYVHLTRRIQAAKIVESGSGNAPFK